VYLIVGLGNPGWKYRDTRHNTGFNVIVLWSRKLGIQLTGGRFQSRFALTTYKNEDILLLFPETFMNLSGMSVRACADAYGLVTGKILVIHDDLDLPVGRIKLIRGGGPGGHKGVLSIIENLGDSQFPRIKIGIGRPPGEEGVEDYVLAPFNDDEKHIMERVLRMAVSACELVVSEGLEPAMNHINSQYLTNKEEYN
jgi:PTH1 family peptidyl-tRNA hydrolase